MWKSGWVLVPKQDVTLLVEPKGADVEPWDYPGVGFMDGEVEGSDLDNLWSLVRGPATGGHVWGKLLVDAPDGDEKIAPVCPEAVNAFANLSDTRIRELAAEWQRARSETSSLPWWKLEDIVEAIQEMKSLAHQQLHLGHRWRLLMVWFM
jgi:hypothetical protein